VVFLNHQKRVSEVSTATEQGSTVELATRLTVEQLHADFNYQCSLNMIKSLHEKGLISAEEKAKILLEIRSELKPYLYQLYPL